MAEINIHVDHSSFNEVYLEMLPFNDEVMETEAKSLEKIYFGGAGSGKSQFIGRAEIVEPFLSKAGFNAFIIMDTYKNVRKSAFPLIKKILNEYLEGNYDRVVKHREDDMRFRNLTNGNEIICLGVEDPESIKSTTFENGDLTCAWVEEADRVHQDIWKELRRRMRGSGNTVPFKRICSYNPVSEDAWCYADFCKDVQMKNGFMTHDRAVSFLRDLEVGQGDEKRTISVPTFIMHTTCEDNRFVDEVYRAELRNEEDPYLKEIYYYGRPGVSRDSLAVVDYARAKRCTEKPFKLDIDDDIGLGCDVAGDGADAMKLKARIGKNQKEIPKEWENLDSNSTTDFARHIIMVGKILQKDRKKITNTTPRLIVNVDKTGVGKGTYDTLIDLQEIENLENWVINGIDFGGSANDKDLYANKATEMYFNIRNMVNEEEIYLIDDSQTLTELCTRQFDYIVAKDSTKFILEQKKKYKKRRKTHSPDDGDGVALAFYEPEGDDTWIL